MPLPSQCERALKHWQLGSTVTNQPPTLIVLLDIIFLFQVLRSCQIHENFKDIKHEINQNTTVSSLYPQLPS